MAKEEEIDFKKEYESLRDNWTPFTRNLGIIKSTIDDVIGKMVNETEQERKRDKNYSNCFQTMQVKDAIKYFRERVLEEFDKLLKDPTK